MDLWKLGLKGRLPRYILNFLKIKNFKVEINAIKLRSFAQETGVVQESILSVTLFPIKINSLAAVIPPGIEASLFVDDLQISCNDYRITAINSKMQEAINAITKWSTYNGYRFSDQKTQSMLLHKKTESMRKLNLEMRGKAIPVVATTKFLGLQWDSKLNWEHHIAQLEAKCLKTMTILKMWSTAEWGADQETVMRT